MPSSGIPGLTAFCLLPQLQGDFAIVVYTLSGRWTEYGIPRCSFHEVLNHHGVGLFDIASLELLLLLGIIPHLHILQVKPESTYHMPCWEFGKVLILYPFFPSGLNTCFFTPPSKSQCHKWTHTNTLKLEAKALMTNSVGERFRISHRNKSKWTL